MPTPTLVATAGSATANSYCTLAEANTYHDSRLHKEDWTTASDATKTVALIMATRLIDALFVWNYFRVDAVQYLEWPKSGVPAKSGLEYIGSTEIPQELKEATAEYARQLIATDRTEDSEVESQGITSLKAGPVALDFKDSVTAKVVPDAVYYLIPTEWGYPRDRSRGYVELLR